MANVTQIWAPHQDGDELFQVPGTAEWWWPQGDNSHYWDFTIRPKSGNAIVEVTREWTVSDNDLNEVEHFIVTVSNPSGRPFRPAFGANLQFTAIMVEA